MHIAVIGDIHGFWDGADTDYFNQSGYDAMLFVGDLPRLTGGFDVARELSRLRKPAWLIPGNHDGCTTLQLLSEIKGWSTLCRLGARGMTARVDKLREALGPVRLCGYEQFELADDLGLIVARPHAMGPDRFYYQAAMQRRYGVDSFAASTQKMNALIDAAPKNLIFLAHNGPAGLGNTAQSIWGCDFSPHFGDFGDPDLAASITHAQATGHQVLAVVGGHMHLRSKNGQRRSAALRREQTLYVNAAEVARIRSGGERRHHVALNLRDNQASAKTVWVDAGGKLVEKTPLS